jgi:hypothetical protein
LELIATLVGTTAVGQTETARRPVGRAQTHGGALGAQGLQNGGRGMVEIQTGRYVATTTTIEDETLPAELAQQTSIATNVLTKFGAVERIQGAGR